MSVTLDDFLAAYWSFFKSNSRVSVVTITALFGVPRFLFVFWVPDFWTCAPRPISEYEAVQSKKAAVLLVLEGLVYTGGLSSLKILIVLETRLFTAGLPCHFPFGSFLNPAFILLSPIVSCLVASFFIWVAFSPVAVAAVVAFPQLVSTGKTIRVMGAPGWPLSAVDAAGDGVVTLPVLVESPLYFFGEFFDGGGDLGVVASELSDRLDQALNGVVFCRGRHSQGEKGLSKFFCHFFTNLLLHVLVSDDGVGCQAGFAGGELLQLLDVADQHKEVFLCWRPRVFNCGLFLPCEVLGVY